MGGTTNWDNVFAEVRRLMMTFPEMWRCGRIDEAMLPEVWEKLDQSEKDYAVKLYARYEHELDPLMPIVRWRAAVRPFVLRERQAGLSGGTTPSSDTSDSEI